MWTTRRGGWPRRRAFGMVARLGSATTARRVAEWEEMSMSNESIRPTNKMTRIGGMACRTDRQRPPATASSRTSASESSALLSGVGLPQLGIHLGAGIVSAIIVATIGAIVLLVILRLVNRGGRW
jgi:hypothetical protein